MKRPRSKDMAVFDKYRDRATRRRNQIKQIPHVFDHKTMLYVGASPDRFEMVDMFYDAGYEIDVMEIYGPNVNVLRKINEKHKIFRTIFKCDVFDYVMEFEDQYDIVLYWHGLEHIHEINHEVVIENCESYAKEFVIFGQPWGEYPQKAVKGNKAERHVSALEPEFFEAFGYSTSIVKKRRGRGSNLVAWKRMGK